MRVLHLLKTAVGASWALRQTRELVNMGIEVHLALPDGPMVEKYQAVGVKTHIFDASIVLGKPWQNFAKAKTFRALVNDIQPDIIHSHFVATTLLMRFALRNVPIPRIFHVPGPLHLEHAVFKRGDLWSANKHDYWMASCIWTKNTYLKHGIEKAKVGLAYYGVNAEDFSGGEQSDLNLRQHLNVDENTFMIGMVAYFYAPKKYLGQSRGLKGHEDLIDAMAIVARTHKHVKCVFVGGPWGDTQDYFQQVQDYAEQQAPGLCEFVGFRSDVPVLYPQLNLAVHPSHSENVGGAVESMYAKVHTLTSNVGGFPDLVSDGETGLLAPAKEPQALADKIIYAIEHPKACQKMIDAGFEKVTQVMNVEHNAKEVAHYYDEVLSHYHGVNPHA